MTELDEFGLVSTFRSIGKVGEKHGRLTINRIGRMPNHRRAVAVCDCDCGTKNHITRLSELRTGKTQSCGCVQRENSTKHGLWDHRLYTTWHNMMRRCYDPKNNRWEDYGGRGIKVCAEWHDLRNFVADMDASFSPGLEIDREDVDGNYTKENCRWQTHAEQARNKRSTYKITCNGETKTAAEWSRVFGVNIGTIYERLNVMKWDPIKAITTPARPTRKANSSARRSRPRQSRG